ncbi:MAG: T9SS C-terminal target domain-containing protein [Calditrichaeota bacterium]|nr:MAG: T9SS C-terminal target domain-containing protein [Calditrichota bacterium]MBL1208146.1 T9SS C-terminal target domain-containing protein [Calditrichota bacterium]NOG47984.1 T9SS type A sorting domain-containing protein [Calditrichota bacterium]
MKNLFLFLIYFIFSSTTIIQSQEILIDSDSKANMWNQPMESPNGNIIVYEKLSDPTAYSNNPNIPEVNVDVWIQNLNTSATSFVTTTSASPHAGAFIKWIDNTHFAIKNSTEINIWDISNFSSPTIDHALTITGASLGIVGSLNAWDYDPNNKYLLTGQQITQAGSIPDVILVDPSDRTRDRVVLDVHALGTPAFIAQMQALLPTMMHLPVRDISAYSWNPEDWMIAHKYFSPDGNYIWIKLTVYGTNPANGKTIAADFGFTFAADPLGILGNDIVFYHADSRSHPSWWDNERIYNDDGIIYLRNGNDDLQVVEPLYDNHIALSTYKPGPQIGNNHRDFIAADNCCGTPLEIHLYKPGELSPLATLFSSPNINLIWGSKDGSRVHPNPSFSRDGKRVYYTRQTNPSTIGLYAYDIPEDIYFTGNGNQPLMGWDDINVHSGWFYSDYTKYITNNSTQPFLQKKGPSHNPSKGYSLPMAVDDDENAYAVNVNGNLVLISGLYPGWYSSDLLVNGVNQLTEKGPWHSPTLGYSLPMVVDAEGNIYVANGKSRYGQWGWQPVGGHSSHNGWYKSDITVYWKNTSYTTSTDYKGIGPWHNPSKGYSLPMAVDGDGNIYSVNNQRFLELGYGWDDVNTHPDWFYSGVTIYYKNGNYSSVASSSKRGPWHNPNKGYSLPMDVDQDGNIYSVNNGTWTSGWDDVNTSGHMQFNGWLHSGFTVYDRFGGEITFNKKGPWHNPSKGFSLPLSVDNKRNVYVANGISRFNRKESLVEIWPSASHYSGQDWYYSDLTVLVNGGGEWYYLDGGPWFNLEKGYSLSLIALGTVGGVSPRIDIAYKTEEVIPSDYKVTYNYPNPFNPVTIIKVNLKKGALVKLTIYNSLGKEISILANEQRTSGEYEYRFNAENYSSGVYFYKLEIDKELHINKMLYLK